MIDPIKGRLDPKFFFKIGPEVVAKFRNHTFMKALDVKGRKFKNYSAKYGESKRSGKMPRQASEFSNSTAPVLTSDLLRDWTMRKVEASGFSFGTMAHGGKVESLARMGRVISTETKPVPDKIIKYIMTEADKYVKKELRKIKGRTFNI